MKESYDDAYEMLSDAEAEGHEVATLTPEEVHRGLRGAFMEGATLMFMLLGDDNATGERMAQIYTEWFCWFLRESADGRPPMPDWITDETREAIEKREPAP